MRRQRPCISFCTLLVLLVPVTASFLLAGPAEYTVTRLQSTDPDRCDGGTTIVTLQGNAAGLSPTDPLTVIESINPEGRIADLTISNISNAGEVTDLNLGGIGVFKSRSVIGNAGGGTNSTTYDPGTEVYSSVSETGGDIWGGSDSFEFGFDRIDGDFDVSIHFESYEHVLPGGVEMVGCWGKYGIMARQTNTPGSAMVHVQAHGPLGQTNPDGVTGTSDCPGGLEGNGTGVQGRRCTGCGAPGTELFQAMVGEPTDSMDAYPDGPFPPTHTDYKYIRLTRVGDLFQGWGTNDADVEIDPTDDARWNLIPIPEHDGGDFVVSAPDNETCWSVGFGNCEHQHGGRGIQTIRFKVLNWEGTTCFDPSGNLGKVIKWSNVTRADVDAGLLTYHADLAPGTESGLFPVTGLYGPPLPGAAGLQKGIDASASLIEGSIFLDIVQTQTVGALTFQGIGGGSGSLSADGSIFEMEGIGEDIWAAADSFAFAYQPVTGDFDAVVNVIDRVSSGGLYPKHGIMMRETCEENSINESVISRERQGPVPGGSSRLAWRRTQPEGGTTTEPFQAVAGSIPGEVDPMFPDFYRIVRTGSQVTGYVSWEDPDNLGEPFHWCYLGARNVQGRPDEQYVGIPISSMSSIPYEVDFLFSLNAYEPAPLDMLVPGTPVFSHNFDSDDPGSPPAGAFWGTRGGGGFDPVVTNGRLRMTDQNIQDAATAVWFKDPALADILETGFIAEYDVYVTKDGLPDPDPVGVLTGEGGMFVVVANASDLFATGCQGVAGTVPVELENLGEVIGQDQGGLSMTQRDDGGTPADPADDVYTNFNTSGGQIWMNCDQLSYDYTEVTGDFDIVTEILDVQHETGAGDWSKWGLMAREGAGSLTDGDRFATVHNDGPSNIHGTTFTVRRSVDGCQDMSELPFRPTSTFLRLTRRGDTIQSFGSDDVELGLGGALDRNNDCNWTPGPSETFPNLDATLNVGFFNHEETDSPLLTVQYRILGPNPGGGVNTGRIFETNLVGFPSHGGYGGGGDNPTPTLGLTGASTCHPNFAVEVDTQESPASNNEGAGSPTNAGQYHIGLNTGGLVDSRQTSDNFGVDAEEMPDIFAPAGVHMRVEYRPNGEIEVHATAGSGGAAGAPDPNDRVISTYIPPLTEGAGSSDPIVGFVASTGAGGSQTLEFDNLTIRALGGSGGFRRGDGDASGTLNINDPIFNLIFQFLGGVTPVCKDALDTDDSGTVTINDPIISLTFQFLGGVTIPLPGPNDCGPDPTNDNEECLDYPQDKCQ